MTTHPALRNLNAEVRAVEEGHLAVVQPGGWVKVKSDTHDGKHFRVDVLPAGVGDPISFLCQPLGEKAFEDDHKVRSADPGVTGCKHAALAARRLQREGLASLVDGLWVVTPKALAAIEAAREIEHVGSVITAAEGARSNFEVVCSCGHSASIATDRREAAEAALARHISAFTFKGSADPFAAFSGR